jgi:NADH dehydrogenase
LEDATIRRRLLLAFEKADRDADPQIRRALLTFVIDSGGPTGMELAGTIGALAHETFKSEYHNIHTDGTKVVLIEAGDRLLAAFRPELRAQF